MSAEPVPRRRPLFRMGATGPDVADLQAFLAEVGHSPGDVDSVFGKETAEAVEQFQRASDLPADGIVGPASWAALERALAGPHAAGARAEASPVPPDDDGGIRASRAVEAIEGTIPGRVTAFAVVESLLSKRADGLEPPGDLGRAPDDAERRRVHQWVEAVRPLFHRGRARELDARHVVRGLALLDAGVAKRLRKDGFLAGLAEQLDPLLTAAGQALVVRPDRKDATAPTLLDRPAYEDQLGRRAFAVALAARLVQLRGTYISRGRGTRVRIALRVLEERIKQLLWGRVSGAASGRARGDGPFLVHLHGAWGDGKSSLLNFFAEQLERPSDKLHEAVWGPDYESYPNVRPWAVVSFNAWQHQRVAPPWWWLMTAVYHLGGQSLPLHRRLVFRLRDYAWRFWARWPAFVIPALGLVSIASAVWYVATETTAFDVGDDTTWFEAVRGIATALTAAVALLASAWAGLRALKRWVLVGTARGAEDFMKTTADPMAFVQRRYQHLVSSLGRPLAVVVDDLDRCKAEYVVELLEGIQTLFAAAPATYVVAADRRWLRECFGQQYEKFANVDGDLGRPLGYHFLEKTFQLSTSVPRLKAKTRTEFLRTLLAPDAQPTSEEREREQEASEEARRAASLQEIRLALKQAESKPAAKREALREALVVRAAAKDIVAQTEYLLADFADLLDPNPRAMKRLVNAYSFETKRQLLEQDAVASDEYAAQRLALWTIASLRWPALVDHLVEHPEWVKNIVDGKRPTNVPAAIGGLFEDRRVRRVFKGDGVEASLRPADVRALAHLDDDEPEEIAAARAAE